VPVHVVTRKRHVARELLSHGFRSGLAPQPPAIGRMHELVPIFLEAFDALETSESE
jgi:hypothetical protein